MEDQAYKVTIHMDAHKSDEFSRILEERGFKFDVIKFTDSVTVFKISTLKSKHQEIRQICTDVEKHFNDKK